jgi:hypothetical protein
MLAKIMSCVTSDNDTMAGDRLQAKVHNGALCTESHMTGFALGRANRYVAHERRLLSAHMIAIGCYVMNSLAAGKSCHHRKGNSRAHLVMNRLSVPGRLQHNSRNYIKLHRRRKKKEGGGGSHPLNRMPMGGMPYQAQISSALPMCILHLSIAYPHREMGGDL